MSQTEIGQFVKCSVNGCEDKIDKGNLLINQVRLKNKVENKWIETYYCSDKCYKISRGGY